MGRSHVGAAKSTNNMLASKISRRGRGPPWRWAEPNPAAHSGSSSSSGGDGGDGSSSGGGGSSIAHQGVGRGGAQAQDGAAADEQGAQVQGALALGGHPVSICLHNLW